MSDLNKHSCTPCQACAPPASPTETAEWLQQLPQWEIVSIDDIPRLIRRFKFKTFRQALTFTNRVGEIAEAEQHHPELITEWGKVTVSWWTHKIGGLHRNDFIMAAKTEQLFAGK